MKNTPIIFAGVLILVVGAGAYLLTQRSTPQQNTTVNENPQQNQNDAISQNAASSERYVAYTKQALEAVAGKRRILYFYANWCPICRPADADLRNNANKIPADVIVIRVNYNDTDTDQEEKELAQKYDITYQHTFVQIDEQGNVVTKWNGGQTEELLENIK